jgi:hypothetical protein
MEIIERTKKIVKENIEGWENVDDSSFEVKRLSGGITNLLVLCSCQVGA